MVCGAAAAPLCPAETWPIDPRDSAVACRVAPYPLGGAPLGVVGREPLPPGVLPPTGALPHCVPRAYGWLLLVVGGGRPRAAGSIPVGGLCVCRVCLPGLCAMVCCCSCVGAHAFFSFSLLSHTRSCCCCLPPAPFRGIHTPHTLARRAEMHHGLPGRLPPVAAYQ
jgi:hypothetical protein